MIDADCKSCISCKDGYCEAKAQPAVPDPECRSYIRRLCMEPAESCRFLAQLTFGGRKLSWCTRYVRRCLNEAALSTAGGKKPVPGAELIAT